MKLMHIHADKLFFGENVRLPHLLNLSPLKDDIIENRQLKTPCVIWRHEIDKVTLNEVLQGNRRGNACLQIMVEFPKIYKEIFPNGLPCIVHDDITEEEAIRIKTDHGNMVSLTDPMELQLSANMLFDIGAKKVEIITSLAGVMNAISPMKADKRKELEAKERNLELAKLSGNPKLVKDCQDELNNFIGEYRYGLYQGLQRAYQNAQIVMETKYFIATGTKRKGWMDIEMPIYLTEGDIYKLHKAFVKDLANDDKYTKLKPGPQFNAAWEKVVKKAEDKAAKKDEEKDDQPKRMPTKDVQDDLDKGKWLSTLAKGMLKYTLGNPEVSLKTLNKLDAKAYELEIVIEMAEAGDPSSIAFINELDARAKEAIDFDNAAGVEAQKSGSSGKSKKAEVEKEVETK